MSIKGIKEALAKKQAQQQSGQQDTDGVVIKDQLRRVNGPVPRPHKKVTGRGR